MQICLSVAKVGNRIGIEILSFTRINKEEKRIEYCSFGIMRLWGALNIALLHYRIILSSDYCFTWEGFSKLSTVVDILAVYGARWTYFFFCLSGYAYSEKYKAGIGEGSFNKYLVGILRKLIPITYISVFFMFILQWIFYFLNGNWWTGRNAGLSKLIGNLLGLNAYDVKEYGDTINGPTWFIFVLILCYIVFFLVKRSCAAISEWLIWISIVVLALSCFSYEIEMPVINSATELGIAAFASGCLISIHKDDFRYISIILFVGVLFLTSLIIYGLEMIGNLDIVLSFAVWPLIILGIEKIYVLLIKKMHAKIMTKIIMVEKEAKNLSIGVFLMNVPGCITISFIHESLLRETAYYNSFKLLMIYFTVVLIMGKVLCVLKGKIREYEGY